jgi:hypothetical protein
MRRTLPDMALGTQERSTKADVEQIREGARR